MRSTVSDPDRRHLVLRTFGDGFPPHLEEVFLSRGPQVLRDLVDMAGGPVVAAGIMGIGRTTVFEWLRRSPGPAGPVRGTKMFHSLWPGYPSPIPLLDRIVERSEEWQDRSYVDAITSRRRDVDDTLRRWRDGTSVFGLRQVMSMTEARRISRTLGISAASLNAVATHVYWPAAWTALDRLAGVDGWPGFIEAVALTRSERTRAPIEGGALSALCVHLLQ